MWWLTRYLLLLGVTWHGCNCLNLMGENIWYPLTPMDPTNFKRFLRHDGAFMSSCGNKRQQVQQALAEQDCFKIFDKKMSHSKNHEAVAECSINAKFITCFKPILKSLQEICGWTEDENALHLDKLAAFEASVNYVCSQNAHLYKAFRENGGPRCLSKARETLETECMTTVGELTPDLMYSPENCKNAFSFHDCLDDTFMDSCDDNDNIDDTMQIVTRAFLEAVAMTPCIKYAPYWFNSTMYEPQPEVEPETPFESENLPTEEHAEEEDHKDHESQNANSQSDKNSLETQPAASRTKDDDDDDDSGASSLTLPLLWTVSLCIFKLM